MTPDKEAIAKLWDEITPKLYGYLINTLRNRPLADDILQTTWLKAIEALPSYDNRGKFSAWVFSIAKNEMRMHWRKSGREVPYNPELHDTEVAEDDNESTIFVSQILNKLSEEDRELVRLRYIGDLSFSEIAKLLQMNSVAVRVKMHRILKNVRSLTNTQYE